LFVYNITSKLYCDRQFIEGITNYLLVGNKQATSHSYMLITPRPLITQIDLKGMLAQTDILHYSTCVHTMHGVNNKFDNTRDH